MMCQDRRVRRTQKLLGEALIALVLEKGFKNITIQDVTDRADIGYRTYFRHYSGLEELAISVAQTKLDEIYEVLELSQPLEDASAPVAATSQSGEILFQYIQENQKILRILLLDNNLRFVLDPIMKMAREKSEEVLNRVLEPNIATSIAANHLITAVFALMRWWLENDMSHSPAQMGEIYANLIIQPTWFALTNE
ncbi:MAG: hypothetical protein MAG431_00331 [Chloroflexi bacterium]|nr:hypothetical protein [Chloroflexota bacterium]